MSEKSITYNPNWRIYRFQLITSVLFIPFIIGIPFFIYFYKRWRKIKYSISNERITITENEMISIPINDIIDIQLKISNPFLGKRTGDIRLVTELKSYNLLSLIDCDVIFDALAAQVEQQKVRKIANSERDRLSVKVTPGSLERLNDLLGLWQQGLISDDDYWLERNKFEK
jgi:hypothetical protein